MNSIELTAPVGRPSAGVAKPALGGALGGLAAIVVWALTMAYSPYARVPEEYGFGMNPPPEVVLAYLAQQRRVDRINMMITFAVGGAAIGSGLAITVAGRSPAMRLAIGIPGGAAWGAAAGFLAVALFELLIPRTRFSTLVDTGGAQAAIFATLGCGLGVVGGLLGRGARAVGVAMLSGALAGGIGGLLGAVATAIVAPTQSTQELVPREGLAIELTFYVFAPFLNRCSTKSLCLIAALSMALRFAITPSREGWTPWTYYFAPSQLLFFVLGMLAYRYYNARVRNTSLAKRTVAGLTAAWCLVACTYANLGLTFEDRYLLEVPFVLLLPYIFELTRSSRIDRALSAWSYPIYLVHSLVLSTYAPLRHFIPLEYYSITVLGLTLIGSALAIRLDEWVESRLKRIPPQKNVAQSVPPAPVSTAPALVDAS